MKKITHYLLAVLFFISCEENKDNYSRYNVQLKIDPYNQFIKVKGNLKYLVKDDSLDALSFNLHKQLKINTFTVNGDNSYKLDTSPSKIRWQPDAIKIIYKAKQKFNEGDSLDVVFSYEGKISQWPLWSANVIGEEWVEMGLYFPWYPTISDEFTYRVSVDIKSDYNVFSMGKSTKKYKERIFENNYPVSDFIICASKEMNVREAKFLNSSFKIVNSGLSNEVIDTILSDIEYLYKFYNKSFGRIEKQDMSLVISKRKKGGGYSRKGGLFLGGISDSTYINKRINYIRYIGHEVAHFWWSKAPTNWEDWLNESFAEYSAMILLRERFGEEEFVAWIDKKRKNITNTPSVWNLDRNHPSATTVLYDKGVVLLNELEEKIGAKQFMELLSARISEDVHNTEDFLSLLREKEGNETADWFESLLKTKKSC